MWIFPIPQIMLLVYGNILIDSSKANIHKVHSAPDVIYNSLKKFASPLDQVKMPLAVSFQSHQWIYVLLMSIWTATLKNTMLCYQELHDQDGVVLWYCFLQHFASTTVKNLIEAYSQLSETKLQLSLFQENVLNITNAVCAPIRCLIRAKETPASNTFFLSCSLCRLQSWRPSLISSDVRTTR
jgi:hypothetical protein